MPIRMSLVKHFSFRHSFPIFSRCFFPRLLHIQVDFYAFKFECQRNITVINNAWVYLAIYIYHSIYFSFEMEKNCLFLCFFFVVVALCCRSDHEWKEVININTIDIVIWIFFLSLSSGSIINNSNAITNTFSPKRIEYFFLSKKEIVALSCKPKLVSDLFPPLRMKWSGITNETNIMFSENQSTDRNNMILTEQIRKVQSKYGSSQTQIAENQIRPELCIGWYACGWKCACETVLLANKKMANDAKLLRRIP